MREESKAVVGPEHAPPKKVKKEKMALKLDDSNGIAVTEKIDVVDAPPSEKSSSVASFDRDAFLAKVETDKTLSLIKAWEESEKTKAQNKAQKKMSSIASWENSKKATKEAQLRKIEEAYEKKKAQYAEKMKNKVAMIHRAAEERRAGVEAKRGEDLLKVEETAAKHRAKGHAPKSILGCFIG